MAKLYFRYGAMNCGKTTALIQVAYNYEERDQSIVLIKPSVDLKGSDHVITRTGLNRKVDNLIKPDESIIETLKEQFNRVNCILVDEAQFLTEKQIEELFVITKIYEVPVICYGLRTDFKTNSFPGSKRLLELADELAELETICRCGSKARFNARKVNGQFVSEGAQVAIDEMDDVTYESVCGKCYLEKVMHYEQGKVLTFKKNDKKV